MMDDDLLLRAEEVRQTVTMWELLDEFDIPYPAPHPSGVKVSAEELGWRPEDVPSVHVYEDHWWDFGSGRGGSVIDFVMAVRRVGFRRAVDELEHLSGGHTFTLPQKVTREPKPVEPPDLTPRLLMESKAISEASLSTYRALETLVAKKWPYLEGSLGSVLSGRFKVRLGSNSIWTPHYQLHRGLYRVTGIKVRSLTDGSKTSIKGSSFGHGLYGTRRVPKPEVGAGAVLVEGESDCWAAAKKWPSLQPFSLPSGAGKWDDSWWSQLDDYEHVLVIMDHDEAGLAAQARIQESYERTHPGVGPNMLWCTAELPRGYDLNQALAEDPDVLTT